MTVSELRNYGDSLPYALITSANPIHSLPSLLILSAPLPTKDPGEMPQTAYPIPPAAKLYESLRPQIAVVQKSIADDAAKHPQAVAGPELTARVNRLLADTRRAVSRLGVVRHVRVLPADGSATLADVAVALAQADGALTAFRAAYWIDDHVHPGFWSVQ